MPTQRPHLLYFGYGEEFLYAPKGGGGTSTNPPAVTNRTLNAARILRELAEAAESVDPQVDALVDSDAIPITVRATTDWGVYPSMPGRKNQTLSVLGHTSRARLNVSFSKDTLDAVQKASERYLEYRPASDARRPNYFNFFEAHPQIALTTVEDVWSSGEDLPPEGKDAAWEVWLTSVSEARFRMSLEMLKLPNPRKGVSFGDTTVIGMAGTLEDFRRIVKSASITQLRPASSLNTSLLAMPPGVQQAAVLRAAAGIRPATSSAPAVCILDTGIYAAHPLLAGSLKFSGAVGSASVDDHDGHGTQMAGVALFEDIGRFIVSGQTEHSHVIESVKIKLPPGDPALTLLPAELVKDAVGQVEASSRRQRVYCLAMNAPSEPDDGAPSSFSCELDALAFEVANRRLFCVSAGNLEVATEFGDYQALNDVTGILSPAQAWNCLCVGASTNLGDVPASHSALAPIGDLSPWSRTAVNWEKLNRPPTKPDVVYEGGNQMVSLADNTVGPHTDLCILTTGADLSQPLALTGQTSPATAAIAGLCATLQSEYEDFWPETIRGLVIHSAEYSEAMHSRVASEAYPRDALLARFGHGQPDRQRALDNAANSLTLIVQDSVRPYRLNEAGSNVVLGKMTFHQLPWPVEVLESLEDESAELRVTLSYFVEPNPGAVLRGAFDEYASHGLQFDIRRPDESDEQAMGRINGLARPNRKSTAAPLNWDFGKARARGSVKHDRWRGPASDLARMGAVMVYPRKGWWADDAEKWQQLARYSLIVSIHTRAEDVYSAIANELQTMV